MGTTSARDRLERSSRDAFLTVKADLVSRPPAEFRATPGTWGEAAGALVWDAVTLVIVNHSFKLSEPKTGCACTRSLPRSHCAGAWWCSVRPG